MSDFAAAVKVGRHYIGYDNEEEYVKLAERRIKEYKQQFTILSFAEKELDFALSKDAEVAYTAEGKALND